MSASSEQRQHRPPFCYYWCCLHEQNETGSWNERNMCTRFIYCVLKAITLTIAIPTIIGIVVGCVVVLMLGVGYIAEYIIRNDMVKRRSSMCFTDKGDLDLFLCTLNGVLWFLIGIIDVMFVNFLFWPCHVGLYDKKLSVWNWVVAIALIPVYFFGFEMSGQLTYYIFGSVGYGHPCTLDSWFSFMTFTCWTQGLVAMTMIGISEGVCVGVVCLIIWLVNKCGTCTEVYERNTRNYPTISTDHDTIQIDPSVELNQQN
jgi:hypothetical protein